MREIHDNKGLCAFGSGAKKKKKKQHFFEVVDFFKKASTIEQNVLIAIFS